VGVAHFARFEEPYLRGLLSPGGELPFDLLCTHELARRLLPGLPRRGLRAVVGYLGHSVSELRRAGHHVAATLLIWRGLVELLEREHGIAHLEELREWLAGVPPRRAPRAYPMEARVRLDVPDQPGVYRFQRTDGSVLYVGKATSLRQRVNTYFQTARGHRERTLEMLAQARAVDVTPTATALEAALLEPDEIKRLRPPYNVALQEKERRLGYWSWTLRRVSLAPDERHPRGPIPMQAPRLPLTALLQLLDSGGGARAAEHLGPSVLGIPRRYAPDLDCFRAGLGVFVSRHGRWWTRGSPAGRLVALAGRLEQRRARGAEAAEGSDDAAPDRRWSAAGVAESLEEVILRGAHALRRSRWLCALAESSLAWAPAETGSRRVLVLSRGAIVERRDLDDADGVPLPPGHGMPLLERQARLDLAAYDRLSALSRELRVLVSGTSRPILCLGPGRVLGPDAVRAALGRL
jgi:DNA polymerase-3 subunit epsilon